MASKYTDTTAENCGIKEPPTEIVNSGTIEVLKDESCILEKKDTEPEPIIGVKSVPEPIIGVKSVPEPITEDVDSGTKEPPVKLSKRAKREKRWERNRNRQREKRREEKKRRNRNKREAGVKTRRTLMSDVMSSKINVAIDCTYNQLMNEREREGLAKQIKYCYSSNRSSPSPLQLHIFGYSNGVIDTLARSCPEHSSWDIYRHNGEITEVFSTNHITYLTADSSNLITELSTDRCYVIGGLLDHNRHKGACLERADKMGLSHGRLGLDEVVELSGRAVLAINHVFDILLRYSSCKDWKEAIISCLPPRKISSIRTADQSESEEKSQKD
ncbi:tRNA methyltransferase 10-like protein A-like [Oopsacas minuta]|uniref:tRNA (guanine(9)-N(1))-methyltransferase n=1 Tax=Oopsacas minuta TaxID=111878 RepID=A0AAV7JMV5_9METZ|nr:tRNA methyltransferase 10-like protein A-like [Oopsacas minuta]